MVSAILERTSAGYLKAQTLSILMSRLVSNLKVVLPSDLLPVVLMLASAEVGCKRRCIISAMDVPKLTPGVTSKVEGERRASTSSGRRLGCPQDATN